MVRELLVFRKYNQLELLIRRLVSAVSLMKSAGWMMTTTRRICSPATS